MVLGEVIFTFFIFVAVIGITAMVFAVWLFVAICRLIWRVFCAVLGISRTPKPQQQLIVRQQSYVMPQPPQSRTTCANPRCSKLNPPTAQFCRRCGQPMPQTRRVSVARAAMW